MKKRILTIILTVVCFAAMADERSKTILDKVNRNFESYKTFRVVFSMPYDSKESIEGRFIVEGDKFFLDLHDTEVFYDGKLRYTYSKTDNTVMIESPEDYGMSVLSNPAKMFSLYDKDFNTEYKGASSVKGKTAENIRLSPKTENEYVYSILLSLDASTLRPVSIAYEIPNVTGSLTIDILSFESNITVSDKDFTFDKSKHPDVEVIDFRAVN